MTLGQLLERVGAGTSEAPIDVLELMIVTGSSPSRTGAVSVRT